MKNLLMLLIFFCCFSCRFEQGVTIETVIPQVPVLTMKDDNTILKIKLLVQKPSDRTVKSVKISLDGTTDLNDIESLRLFTDMKDAGSGEDIQFGKTCMPSSEIIFNDEWKVNRDTTLFRLSVKLKDTANLLHRVCASCEYVETSNGIVKPSEKNSYEGQRIGTALRQHNDDGVHTYRIPGLTTTKNGTLLAVYDVRRNDTHDLQGDIDIGLSRSTDGGNTWEPMRIVLDRGIWGGLPQKYNGISDACILVDKNTNTVFVAGLWMYGLLDDNGKWIKGLDENSTARNHQWSKKGSQPGFDVKQTSQFMIAKSTDDGQSWSEPVNLTKMCKKEEWWLWAPAPGAGITLDDGTLVFPTQGRDENGDPFSNITWSKNGGETWHTSNFASRGTNENMIVQLSSGAIMLNARNPKNKENLSATNGRVISVSNDLGETWVSHPTSQGTLIEPACMANLYRHFYTENGVRKSILLFSNPNSKIARDHIMIKVSFDDGATWPEKYWLLLDEGKGRGYSCITSIDEQTIGILYEGSQADMTFQKIALNELIGK